MLGWAIIILGLIALLWYRKQLWNVGDFTLVATGGAVESATRFDDQIRNAADCANAARDSDNMVAMYQAPIHQTGGYGKSGVKKTAPGYCLAFKTIRGLSLVDGATPGQTVMAKPGTVFI